MTFDEEKGLGQGEYLKLVCPAPQLYICETVHEDFGLQDVAGLFRHCKVYFTTYYSTWRVADANSSHAGSLMKEALLHFYQKILGRDVVGQAGLPIISPNLWRIFRRSSTDMFGVMI